MFIPSTVEEMRALGWDGFDIILVTGDAYIDSPYVGVSLIGHHLINHGFRVGIISQPDVESDRDIMRLGTPDLFFGVTGGAVDSMVSNYTASKKRRRQDDLTPGGVNNRRPDRASIAYSNLIRRFHKQATIVLGGIEASLRRIPHYDYWSNSVRRSILFDSRADILVYGMGESSTLALATAMREHSSWNHIRGICYKSDTAFDDEYITLPSFDEVRKDKAAFAELFVTARQNCDPLTAMGLQHLCNGKWLIHNPPSQDLATDELDSLYAYDYEYTAHPRCLEQGEIRALDTTRFSITSHRGCYGNCSFCAISMHQGQRVVSRSEESILAEVTRFTRMKGFKGNIFDVGGPSANMYGIECKRKEREGHCGKRECLFPSPCPSLKINHSRQLQLLQKIRLIDGVKHVFIASGIRYDMVIADNQHCSNYVDQLVAHHVSGQLKIAPEHVSPSVLGMMHKPSKKILRRFRDLFLQKNREQGKKQFLTYYFMAAHPGCSMDEMKELKNFCRSELRLIPEQIQIFTPTPSTISTLIFYTGVDPFSGSDVFVERDLNRTKIQKDFMKKREKGSHKGYSNQRKRR